jgi:hypothetical protein
VPGGTRGRVVRRVATVRGERRTADRRFVLAFGAGQLNVETALEVAALGIADAITARSVLRRQQSKLAAPLFSASLQPCLYDHFAIVHRPNSTL